MGPLSVAISDEIAVLTIGGTNVPNAINLALLREMHLALDRVQKRENGARAVVITGTDDVFCSGVDLRSLSAKRGREHFQVRKCMDPLIVRMSRFRYPIIAAVNGVAAGAGMSLALAADIIIAGEKACFLPSFARLGLVPDAGITFHLARCIGHGRALSALMLGDKIDATTALDWGLAYEVVPTTEVLARAVAIALRLARGPIEILSQIRSLHSSTFNNTLKQQLSAERIAQTMTVGVNDCAEGAKAFFEKREPNFSKQ